MYVKITFSTEVPVTVVNCVKLQSSTCVLMRDCMRPYQIFPEPYTGLAGRGLSTRKKKLTNGWIPKLRPTQPFFRSRSYTLSQSTYPHTIIKTSCFLFSRQDFVLLLWWQDAHLVKCQEIRGECAFAGLRCLGRKRLQSVMGVRVMSHSVKHVSMAQLFFSL